MKQNDVGLWQEYMVELPVTKSLVSVISAKICFTLPLIYLTNYLDLLVSELMQNKQFCPCPAGPKSAQISNSSLRDLYKMTLNSGFDPEDPPPPIESPSKPPWESTLQTDHRRSAVIYSQYLLLLEHKRGFFSWQS